MGTQRVELSTSVRGVIDISSLMDALLTVAVGQVQKHKLWRTRPQPRKRKLIRLRVGERRRNFNTAMMTEAEKRQFEEICAKYYSGGGAEALHELYQLIPTLEPMDKAGVSFYEVIWLLELDEIRWSRERLHDLTKSTASLIASTADIDEPEEKTALAVMVRFAEAKLLEAEGCQFESLRALENLKRQFPKQLTTPGLQVIADEIQVLQGMTLGNLDRWKEALPLLQTAVSPEGWGGILAFYVGRCYYELGDYSSAECKLTEALEIGLTPKWEPPAHYVLGLTEYNLGKNEVARRHFELCAKTGDAECLAKTKIWEWLEATRRRTGPNNT